MEQIRTFIEKYTSISDSDWDLIIEDFKPIQFDKNEIIHEEGMTCRHFYFLESGLIRFFSNIDGIDITKAFTKSPYCFTSKTSFRKQFPAMESIQALVKTKVWQISHEDYKKLEFINSWNVFMRKILHEIDEYSEKFYLDSKILTAEERYKNLYDEHPAELLQKIPLKHLSTYLGIAPQSLSRIRNKLNS